MLELIGLIGTVAVTIFGYLRSRDFVQRRLTYVDAVHTAGAPILVGAATALIAAPVAWALPIIGGGTALLFGAGVGAGVAAGRGRIRQQIRAG